MTGASQTVAKVSGANFVGVKLSGARAWVRLDGVDAVALADENIPVEDGEIMWFDAAEISDVRFISE